MKKVNKSLTGNVKNIVKGDTSSNDEKNDVSDKISNKNSGNVKDRVENEISYDVKNTVKTREPITKENYKQ